MITFLLLSVPLFSRADIYTYTDVGGIVHFTDNIPDKSESLSFRIFERSGRAKIFFKVTENQLDGIINMTAKKHGLEKELVKAVIKAESDFDPKAISKKGAVGLMQLLPKTAYSMGVDNIEDPSSNIDTGCRLLKSLLNKYNGDIELSLAAYNAGETAVNKHKGIPPYKETINYVQKVIKYYNNNYKKSDLQAFYQGPKSDDAKAIKNTLQKLFENDASSARPEGSMEVVKLFWWQHNCPSGQYPSAKVHRTLIVEPKPDKPEPKSAEDYIIKTNDLEGLKPEVLEGF